MAVRRLPDEVVRRIAAGEVVDHPNSVVKELVENALDAKASSVKVSIQSGGKSKITVEDDGIGMGEEDLKVAVLPHTTSKIEKFEDLFDLSSYGFRGEALASIGAVSKMRVETSDKGEVGFAIEVNGGEISEVERIVKRKGTTVTVSELFFNVPARRKFLSSASVEARMVTETVQKFILSHDLAFEYLRDGEEIFSVSKGMSLLQRIKTVFSKEELVEVNAIFGGVKVYGYVSPPNVGRKNRTSEAIFVNGRYVRSGLLMKAIEAGYAEHLKKGEFPIAVIFIDLPPQLVDVNVHPQKLEVRFSDSSKIFYMVSSAVKKSLASPSVFQIPTDTEEMRVEENTFTSEKLEPKKEIPSRKETFFDEESAWTFKAREEAREPIEEEKREKLSESKILGVLHGRYIACETEKALYLIDMHAAHERILYDEFKSRASVISQHLTTPLKLELTEVQRELLNEHADAIKGLGFDWSEEGLIAVPQVGKQLDWEGIFIDVLESFRLSFAQDPRDELFASLACKTAIKSNERISADEIEEILKKVDNLEIWSCPHGRPLVYSIEFSRLDRYFGR